MTTRTALRVVPATVALTLVPGELRTSVGAATRTTGSPDDAGPEAEPSDPPPTIATTTSTTTTTSPPVDPPTIGGFRISPQVDACGPGTLGTAVGPGGQDTASAP